jgi:hypothetical protein
MGNLIGSDIRLFTSDKLSKLGNVDDGGPERTADCTYAEWRAFHRGSALRSLALSVPLVLTVRVVSSSLVIQVFFRPVVFVLACAYLYV